MSFLRRALHAPERSRDWSAPTRAAAATSQLLGSAPFVRRAGRGALAVLRFPGVAAACAFYVIYKIAARKWCDLFCGSWEPAFPRAWTVWVLLLITIPIHALLQLSWLLVSTYIVAVFRRRVERGRRDVVFSYEEGEHMRMIDGDPEEHGGEGQAAHASAVSRKGRQRPDVAGVWWWTRCAVLGTVVLVGVWSAAHYEHPGDVRFRPALARALADREPRPAGYGRGETIFIAAAFYNNELVLPYWTTSLLAAIRYLGTANVFVSVVENHSGDRTADMLRALGGTLDRMGVKNRMLLGDAVAVERPPDMSWNPRIEFLSAIRNRALEPLVEHGGYEKVLFSNDIFVEPESIIELLETNGGDYDMACGMDFNHFGAYDMWVLRDRVGRLTAGIWPYFFDATGYNAIKKEEPIPVFSCWNGIVAFRADPVLPVALRPGNSTLSTDPLTSPLPDTHPAAHDVALRGPSPALTPPTRFRASAPGECFSSESFLLPYDMRRLFGMTKIYMNSRVAVGYVWKYYVWHKWVLRHPAVRWFVQDVWDGAWMQYARMIVGDAEKVYNWDGGDCHPW